MPFYRICPVDSHTCVNKACLGDGHSWDALRCTKEPTKVVVDGKTGAVKTKDGTRCPHGNQYYCGKPPCSSDGVMRDLQQGKAYDGLDPSVA